MKAKMMRRFTMLLGGLTLAGIEWCDTSYVKFTPDSEQPGLGHEDPQRLARATASADLAYERTWSELRQRYHAALDRAGPRAVHALREARLAGSSTLARDHAAVARFYTAMQSVDHPASRTSLPTPEDAMRINALVAGELQHRVRRAGEQAIAGTTQRRYLAGARVARELDDAFDTLHGPIAATRPTPEVAALFDQQLISIHPFFDGNGRTTRLLTDWILGSHGYPPIVHTRSAARMSGGSHRVTPTAHLDRITDGMRASVAIVEAVA